jgi:hypothetical protein
MELTKETLVEAIAIVSASASPVPETAAVL